jgi:CheY-like chemotaxis protein
VTIVKSATHKSNVKIVVADDEAFMREIVVNTLTSGGYREIRSITKLGLLQEVVDSLYPDLMILNGDMADGDSVDFVRRMRLHRIGRNPFVPVIMTAWSAEQSFVRKVVDSGADVLVTKPFAAGQLYARIEFLATARPPFVVTSSYIGPDRRKSPRGDNFPRFDVPNTLKDRFDGRDFHPEDLGARIAKVFPGMMKQRLRCQEQDIGSQYAAIAKATRECRPVKEISSVITAIADLTARYAGEMMMVHGGGDADQATALAKRLRAVAAAETGFSDEDCDAMEKMLDALGIMVPAVAAPAAGSDDMGASAPAVTVG